MCSQGFLGAYKSSRPTARNVSSPLNHSKHLKTTSVASWDSCASVGSRLTVDHSVTQKALELIW